MLAIREEARAIAEGLTFKKAIKGSSNAAQR
jgi:hypothetical protein